MASCRRLAILVLTVVPLLGAQCWGACGLSELPVAQPASSCHETSSSPEDTDRSDCCAGQDASLETLGADLRTRSLAIALSIAPEAIEITEFLDSAATQRLDSLPPAPTLHQNMILRL